MSSVSVGSLQAESSSARPEMTMGKRKGMRKSNRRSSLLLGVLMKTVIEISSQQSVISNTLGRQVDTGR